MPDSTFFDPMSIGGAPFPTNGLTSSRNPPTLDYQTQQNLRIKAGYTNQYGTDAGVSFTPDKSTVEAHANFPIGAYENGTNFGVSGFVRPGSAAGASDFGGMLTIGKVNRAQASAADVLSNLVNQKSTYYQNHPEEVVKMQAYYQAHPDELESDRRNLLDARNQIGLPGSRKYQLNLGVDTNVQRSLTPGSIQSLQDYNESQPAGSMAVGAPGVANSSGSGASGTSSVDPATFTRNYARNNVIPIIQGTN